MGFPGGSDGKESTCNVGELGSAPGLGRSPEEKNNYPQYSCLENSMGKGWQAIVYGVAKHRTQPSDFHLCFPYVLFPTDLHLNWKGQTNLFCVYSHKISFHQKKEISYLIRKPKASPKRSSFLGCKINLTFEAQRKEVNAEILCEINSTDFWVGGSKVLWGAHYFWVKPLGPRQGRNLDLISTGLP